MSPMNGIVVVTAVGRDQPGIVAALTGAIFELGGNLDDATMTRLHGAFAAMLSARLPLTVAEDQARAALAPVAEVFGLSLTVQGVTDPAPAEAAPDHLITVYGADRPGIVHQVASLLADAGVNITDMDTRVAGLPGEPFYVMQLEVAAGGTDLVGQVSQLRDRLRLDVTIQPLESEAL